MIVTTPEKWDVITRKGGEVGGVRGPPTAAPGRAAPWAGRGPPLAGSLAYVAQRLHGPCRLTPLAPPHPHDPIHPSPPRQVSVAATVRLLIIDEVHLLNDERGPVIETLVARTTRQVRPVKHSLMLRIRKSGAAA